MKIIATGMFTAALVLAPAAAYAETTEPTPTAAPAEVVEPTPVEDEFVPYELESENGWTTETCDGSTRVYTEWEYVETLLVESEDQWPEDMKVLSKTEPVIADVEREANGCEVDKTEVREDDEVVDEPVEEFTEVAPVIAPASVAVRLHELTTAWNQTIS